MLRMVRDLLVFQPVGSGTDIRLALDTVHQMLKRRSIVFLISDFLAGPESYRQAMLVTNRRHDVVAFDLSDPLEHDIADVGIMALEDAESGQLRWVDTGSSEWRREFLEQVARVEEGQERCIRRSRCGPHKSDHRKGLRTRGRGFLQRPSAKVVAMRIGDAIRRLPVPNRESGGRLAIRSPIALAIVVVLSAAAIGTALAQSPPPSGILISFTSDRSELTVGDPVTLTLGVMYAQRTTRWCLPRIGPEWGPFEVRSQATAQTISNGRRHQDYFPAVPGNPFCHG